MAHKRFYIDLDFIFDTRISLLHRLDPDYIKREFDIEKYRNRTNDWFATPTTKFTEAEWLEAWANRGKPPLPSWPGRCVDNATPDHTEETGGPVYNLQVRLRPLRRYRRGPGSRIRRTSRPP